MKVFKTVYFKITDRNGHFFYEDRSFLRDFNEEAGSLITNKIKELEKEYPHSSIVRVDDDEYIQWKYS